MIHYDNTKDYGTLICDTCHAREVVPASDIGELMKNASDIGWDISKTGIGWEHFCLVCNNQ